MDPRSLPKILYIDDTPDSRRLVSRILSREYVVLEANDAISGIELAVDTQPDLILLDINLPEFSGREAAVRLRTLLPDTPLVAFSADVTDDAREKALAAGFIGYLTKPIENIEDFSQQIREFLSGKRDAAEHPEQYQQMFAAEVVTRLEEKIRELTRTAERNDFLNTQNRILITDLQRHQRLLEAAARISHAITSILDLEQLLDMAVRTICDEYGFSFSAIFLLDEEQKTIRLRAAHGGCDEAVPQVGLVLAMDDPSVVGQAIQQGVYQIQHTVDELDAQPKLPSLVPSCQLELALPLIVKGDVLGALSLHSQEANTFDDQDMPAFEALVDQLAIAISNARSLRDLEEAHQELLRVKTFEAIATATGEAIHWVGNKAAPIPGSASRVKEDTLSLVAGFVELLKLPADQRKMHPLWPAWQATLDTYQDQPPVPYLLQNFTLESILEDLTIIEQSANTILNVKEDLIGPARLRNVKEIHLAELIEKTVFEMRVPEGVIQTDLPDDLPPIKGDDRQLGQVFNNLLKNAWEARPDPKVAHIQVSSVPAEDPKFVTIQVKDNGPGIPPEILEKIWVSFFTTKGDRGGTGLGLSACMAIVNQLDGKISVESEVGVGTTFRVSLPVTS